jgi:hypothetical protein
MKRGHVYFLECGDFIKIGWSQNARMRINGLQNSLPFEIRVLCISYGDVKLEKALHAKFAHLRHRGEWFRKSAEIYDEIKSLSPWTREALENESGTTFKENLETWLVWACS